MKLRGHLFALSIGSLLCLGGAGCSTDPIEVEEDSGAATSVKDAGGKDGASKTDAKVVEVEDDVADEQGADDDDDDDDDDDKPVAVADAGTSKVDAGGSKSDAGKEPVADAGKPTTKPDAGTAERFSFFVTSVDAMRRLSKNENGFGGDLRYGETGEGAGLRGADKICTEIAETSMPGSGAKVWHAFLSTTKGGPDGGPVHAIDRIGEGPWYDRKGRLVSNNKTDILMTRPGSADATIKNDLPNEDGVPNHDPDGTGQVDNHDILTGTNDKGQLYKNDVKVTCNDWTKSEGDSADAPRVGHSWPRMGGGGGGRPGGGGPMGLDNWMSSLDEAGCGAGISLVEMGPPKEQDPTVGSGGGYGGIYCFALTP